MYLQGAIQSGSTLTSLWKVNVSVSVVRGGLCMLNICIQIRLTASTSNQANMFLCVFFFFYFDSSFIFGISTFEQPLKVTKAELWRICSIEDQRWAELADGQKTRVGPRCCSMQETREKKACYPYVNVFLYHSCTRMLNNVCTLFSFR